MSTFQARGTKEITSASLESQYICSASCDPSPRASPAGPNPSRQVVQVFERPKDVLQWRGIMLTCFCGAYCILFQKDIGKNNSVRVGLAYSISKSTNLVKSKMVQKIQYEERSLIRPRPLEAWPLWVPKRWPNYETDSEGGGKGMHGGWELRRMRCGRENRMYIGRTVERVQ